MYQPKHWHWTGPVASVLTGFYLYNQFPSWDVVILVQLPLAVIASEWGAYIWQAGVMYQGYLTGKSSDLDQRQRDRDAQAKGLAWAMDNPHTMTSGNTPVIVPMAKPAIHPGMVEHQFIATQPVLNQWRVQMMIKRLCKRQFAYRDHLGKPEGDYREETWVKSGELTRRALTICLGILEHAGGIRRKNKARNSTYITARWDVIQLGAQGSPLPHPKGCECDDCAVK